MDESLETGMDVSTPETLFKFILVGDAGTFLPKNSLVFLSKASARPQY